MGKDKRANMMFRKSLIMSITESENSMMTKKGKKKKHVPKQNHIIRTRSSTAPFFFHFQELGITDSGHET